MHSASLFSRTSLIQQLRQRQQWDIVIIGGGATGLGTAVDAASRGYSTLLLEQHDFAKGTSSRSTKLVHGGVRYLAQGDLKLVYSALRERNILARNAPHIVRKQSFIVPCYSMWDLLKYGTGLKLYDLLAGRFSFGSSRILSVNKTKSLLPTIATKRLRGGIRYFDGQFDDARLAINLAQSAIELGAVVLNYFKVSGIRKQDEKINGVVAFDEETGEEFEISAKVVVNATGVFVDDILKMDEPAAGKLVRSSRGVHLVVKQKYLQSENALMIPKTSDGRVLFAVPWYDHVVIGTTDTPIQENALEPAVPHTEVQFILDNIKQYFSHPPDANDILCVFAGLRPLAAETKSADPAATKELSRDHKLIISKSGLVTITGGKWTTYRKMAEETINEAARVGGLNMVKSNTATLAVHGASASISERLGIYGKDAEAIRELMKESSGSDLIINGHPYTKAEVRWAVRNEMARTVEDVVARRLRLLFLDVEAAVEAAPVVAEIIAEELGYDEKRIKGQLHEFFKIASYYRLKP